MWEAAGSAHGRALQFWLEAERELLAQMQAGPHRIDPGEGSAAGSPATEPREPEDER